MLVRETWASLERSRRLAPVSLGLAQLSRRVLSLSLSLSLSLILSPSSLSVSRSVWVQRDAMLVRETWASLERSRRSALILLILMAFSSLWGFLGRNTLGIVSWKIVFLLPSPILPACAPASIGRQGYLSPISRIHYSLSFWSTRECNLTWNISVEIGEICA